MFEKVSRSLKYDSNIFFVHKHMDTTTDHFTPLALRVRGNDMSLYAILILLVNDNSMSAYLLVLGISSSNIGSR